MNTNYLFIISTLFLIALIAGAAHLQSEHEAATNTYQAPAPTLTPATSISTPTKTVIPVVPRRIYNDDERVIDD